MPKRNLRIVTRTPIAIGICESCNMQFKSHQPIEDHAEVEMGGSVRRAQVQARGRKPSRCADRERVHRGSLSLGLCHWTTLKLPSALLSLRS